MFTPLKNQPTQHTVVREIRCKSILNRSRISGIDYALNPYMGCEHACVYCYSDFMGRFRPHPEPWGQFVDVKVNAAQILRRQLKRAKPGLISMSTVTDPYQPAEQSYRLTRACLEEIKDERYSISILTKSDLVLRDLDLLRGMQNLEVAFTITTLDENVRETFEPGAPSITRRLRALREVSQAGIRTWVFVGPVLPHFSDRREVLGEMLTAFRDHGARRVLVDRLNFYPRVWSRVRMLVSKEFPQQLAFFEEARRDGESYALELRSRILELSAQLGLPCEVIF
jgi:DNA repair photolyase